MWKADMRSTQVPIVRKKTLTFSLTKTEQIIPAYFPDIILGKKK
jgi:hypothetical protein